jgi:opine dehydrogenase
VKVAILGAGAGGVSAAVDLSQRAHEVRLWNRSPETLQPLRAARGITYSGVLGEGFVAVDVITTDLAAAARNADVLLVCLPSLALGSLAADLVRIRVEETPVVLNAGHTGGALEFAQTFRNVGRTPPPTVEFSTLTYVARKSSPDRVATTGRAKAVRAAALPGGSRALQLARELYDCAKPAANVIATSLSNVNIILHPPGAVLGSAWIQATSGDFTFYVQGLTDGVARVMEQLDVERLDVARALGEELTSLFDEMRAIGTIESGADRSQGLAAAIRAGDANRSIRAPASLRHRYFHEDFWYGLKPFLAFAAIAKVDTPIARALWTLGETLLGPEAPSGGRSAAQMGIEGLTVDQLRRMVTEPK